MEMTKAVLLKLIDDNGGDTKVAAILFNNAYRKVFTKERFDRTKHLVTTSAVDGTETTTIDFLRFTEEETGGFEYHVFKQVGYVEAVIFIDNEADRVKMNPRYIAG